MTAPAEILKKVDLFDGVDTDTLDRLLAAGRRARSAVGEFIVRQGEFGDSFFVLLAGQASVQVAGDDGKLREVARLGPGQYFGELALLGRGERKASVQSRTETELLELRRVHFDQALRKHKQVKTRLERLYVQGALDAFIKSSRYFKELPEPAKQQLVTASNLETHSKDEFISRQGDAAQKLYIVRTGFVRISRALPDGGAEILAYLGPEDFFGDEEVTIGAEYGASAVAVEPVEVVAVPRSVVWSLYLKHPEMFASFRRYSLARTQQQSGILQSQTAMGFVRDMLEAGLGQARSALIINLDTCVRCGNCVQACDDLHGYSRLARRGKKLVRRTQADSRRHESLYFPTSCLQCATPECMVGCPTGAIARDVGGEVYIKDTCIGCGNCARNCDFGNIAMARVKEPPVSLLGLLSSKQSALPREETVAAPAFKGEPAKSELIAVKCDVCFEREFAACVYNCPVEAVLRIDPRQYFDELKQIAPKLALQGGPVAAKTQMERPTPLWVNVALQWLALIGGLVVAWYTFRTLQPSSWHGLGMYAGITGAAMIGLLGLIGLRKRMRIQRLGKLATWARLHAVLGGLLTGVVLFHAGWKATSTLTATLLVLLIGASLVGLLGQLASLFLPRILARSEDEALLPEDVGPRISQLLSTNSELLAGIDEKARPKIQRQVDRLVEGGLSYVLRGLGAKALGAALAKRAKKMPALPESEHALALRIAENVAQVRLLGARRALELLLTGWVPLHLVTSAMAVMLLIGHLMTVLLW